MPTDGRRLQRAGSAPAPPRLGEPDRSDIGGVSARLVLSPPRRRGGCPRCNARSLYREVEADVSTWCCFSCDWREFDGVHAGAQRKLGTGPVHAGKRL
jgi:hypothetical protein